jgi:hypothetical protein
LSASGRLVKVERFGWGIVLGLQKDGSVTDVLLCCHPDSDEPAPSRAQCEFRALPCALLALEEVGAFSGIYVFKCTVYLFIYEVELCRVESKEAHFFFGKHAIFLFGIAYLA